MRSANDNRVEKIWYGGSPLRWLLLPFSWLYAVIVASRRFLYKAGLFHAYDVPVPVIVIGNITAGGTGKTPVSIWLARALKHKGLKPGIISRGYRGAVGSMPVEATADSDPSVVGDEAILLAALSGCPVVVHPERIAAAKKAIELGADIIISDDGLQHLRLGRNFEIAVVDGTRGFGNGKMLPAGPLRDPVRRLRTVDKVLVHRHPEDEHKILRRATDRRALNFWLRATAVCRLDDSDVRHIDDFAGQTVNSIAGIGHPERFFRMLKRHGIEAIPRPLSDHAEISQEDITFDNDHDVFMTQKDAVKCRWLDTSKCWYVPVEVEFEGSDAEMLVNLVMQTYA